MGVTVGWLLGLPKLEEKQPPAPPPEPELRQSMAYVEEVSE